MPDDKRYRVGEQCPLPFAGPPVETPSAVVSTTDATSRAARYMVSVGLSEAKANAIALLLAKTIGFKPLPDGSADANGSEEKAFL